MALQAPSGVPHGRRVVVVLSRQMLLFSFGVSKAGPFAVELALLWRAAGGGARTNVRPSDPMDPFGNDDDAREPRHMLGARRS